jgi:uncharacterized protein YggE
MKRTINILSFAVLAAMIMAIALPASAQQGTNERTITVTGFGSASGAPDVAFVMLGVQVNNADPTAAFNGVNSGISAVRDAMLALGIAESDLQTIGLNMWVQESYDSSGMATGNRTYNATNTLNITVRDIALAGDVVTAGINAGANIINGLSFGIDDPSGLAQEARIEAVADARARAQQLAGLLGLTLGDVVSIDESVRGGALPEARLAAAPGMGGGGGGISEGLLSVSVQVTITFAAS